MRSIASEDLRIMNDPKEFSVILARWPQEATALRSIRTVVFVEEQNVPESLEWDGLDDSCQHAIAKASDGTPIGCVRLLPDGHIGRMAVLSSWRKNGVGSVLLNCIVEHARTLLFPKVMLNEQVHAIPFYSRHGFKIASDVFEEAGIPHRAMEKSL